MSGFQERNVRLWTYLSGVFTNELCEESSRYQGDPPAVSRPLYIHQKTLLDAAINLERSKYTGLDCGENRKLYTNYGVLADRVGSGKSLVALSLVKQPIPDEREIITTQRHNSLAIVCHHIPEPKRRRCKAALFIIPHSLMGQWEGYLQNDTTLNVIFCKRKKEARDPTIINFIDNVDAIFISSTMWKDFEEVQKPETVHWSRIFVDEADSIQSSIRTQLSANFIWLITASFLNIAFPTGMSLDLNSPYYAPPTFVEPQLVERIRQINGREFRIDGSFTNSLFIKNIVGQTDIMKNTDLQAWRVMLRNTDSFIDQSFSMPPIIHHEIMCKTTANIRILESLIPNEAMEMLHAGDTKGALQLLGVRDESPTSIIASLTHTLRKDLEQQQRKLEFYKTMEYSSEAAKQKSLETQQGKINSLESRIDAIEKRMENANTTNCPICYSEAETPTMTPCCKNLFCLACLCESLKRQTVCPLCRATISSVNELHVVKQTNSIVSHNSCEANVGPKTKIEEFIDFVEKNKNSKILLFSGYDASFFNLTSEMAHRNISFSAINGSTARVSKIIDEFEKGNYRVLLLNSKHVGAGLNIVCATDVFLFHKMTSEMEKQIIGRAYRMGRTKDLHVHHLLYQTEKNSPSAQ
jgi:hypothetical protein